MEALASIYPVDFDGTNFPRKPGRWSWLPGEFPFFVKFVLFKPLYECIYETLVAQELVKRTIRVSLGVLSPAVAKVDLLIGVKHEEVDRVHPVEIEEADIDSLQLRDTSTDILLKELSHEKRWASHNLRVECFAFLSLHSAELNEHRLAGRFGLL
jgi:hypothetical protein